MPTQSPHRVRRSPSSRRSFGALPAESSSLPARLHPRLVVANGLGVHLGDPRKPRLARAGGFGTRRRGQASASLSVRSQTPRLALAIPGREPEHLALFSPSSRRIGRRSFSLPSGALKSLILMSPFWLREDPDSVHLCLISVYGSARQAEAEISHPMVWELIRRIVQESYPDRPEMHLPAKPMRRHHYAYGRDRYLSDPVILARLLELHRTLAGPGAWPARPRRGGLMDPP
jgi:hypothetical protein